MAGFRHSQALFFLLLSALAYLLYHASSPRTITRRVWYGCSILAFAASLLSYPIGIGLAAVYILLDVYPLKRLPLANGRWLEAGARSVWLEKLPFFAVAGIILGVTLLIRFQSTEHLAKTGHPRGIQRASPRRPSRLLLGLLPVETLAPLPPLPRLYSIDPI